MHEKNAACFSLPAALTIATVGALREELLCSLDTGSCDEQLRVDGSAVDTVDAAGIQLLIALEREAVARQSRLSLLDVSPTLEEALTRLGLSATFTG